MNGIDYMSAQTELSLASHPVTRRALLCGLTAAALGVIPETAQAANGITQPSAGKIRVDLKVNKNLAKVGGVVTIPLSNGATVALVRTAAGVKGFTALDLSCTHQGVTVQEQGSKWICPAHGSQFALNGKLVNGPARSALQKYPVSATSAAVIIG